MSILEMPVSDNTFSCRRDNGEDRRKAHFKASVLSFFNTRRRTLRRDGNATIEQLREAEKPFSYGLLFGILIFLILDAFLSLSLVSLVGDNSVSIIQIVSQNSALQSYFLAKSIIASLCVFFVAIYQSVPALSTISAARIVGSIMLIYLALIALEITLIV